MKSSMSVAEASHNQKEKIPNILVVDDEVPIRELLNDFLTQQGFGVILAGNGEEAIKLIEKEDVEIALLDVKIPGMSGIELLGRIKLVSPNVEAIMISGHTTVDSAVEALRLGAFDYINKPFGSLDNVSKVIQQALDKRKLHLENISLTQGLKKRVHELEVLYEVSNKISFTLDYKQLKNLLLDSLKTVIEYDTAGLLLVEDEGSVKMSLQVIREVSTQFVESARSNLIEMFHSVSSSTLSADTPFEQIIGSENIRTDNTLAGKEQEISSVLNIPLKDDKAALGIINISSGKKNSFSEDDARLLRILANQISTALQRLRGLIASEKFKMDKLVESMTDGVIMINEDFEVLVANPSAISIINPAGLTSYPSNKKLQDIMDFKDLKERFSKEEEHFVKKEIGTPAGSYEAVVSPIKDADQKFKGMVISLRDVTEEKRLETLNLSLCH